MSRQTCFVSSLSIRWDPLLISLRTEGGGEARAGAKHGRAPLLQIAPVALRAVCAVRAVAARLLRYSRRDRRRGGGGARRYMLVRTTSYSHTLSDLSLLPLTRRPSSSGAKQFTRRMGPSLYLPPLSRSSPSSSASSTTTDASSSSTTTTTISSTTLF